MDGTKLEYKKKALFLDRDGVININYGYVHKQSDFDFIDGIFDLLKIASESGYIIIVITNQAGIGRGYYTEADFNELTDWMCNVFFNRGIKIQKVYFSPYHPVHGLGKYKKDDESRKPKPGMLIKAISEFNINAEQSILIGDSLTDIEAGIGANIGTNILLSEDNSLEKKNDSLQFIRIDNILDSLYYLKKNDV